MKKKRLIVFLIAVSFVSATLFSGCNSEDPDANATIEESYISVNEEDAGAEETETVVLEWDAGKMEALSDVISGIGGEITGDEGIREIRGLLNYDTSIVKEISFDTSGIDFGTAGSYDVPYTIVFDREALLDWMEESDVAVTAYPGLDVAESPRIRAEVTGVITVTSDAEIASESDLGDSETNESDSAAGSSSNEADSGNPSSDSESSSSENSSGSSSSGSTSSGSSGSGSSSGNSSSSSSTSSGSSSGSSSSSSGSSGSSNSSKSSSSSSGNSSGSSSGSSSGTSTAHKHSYTSTVTKAATCGSTGVRTYTCSCGASYTETIAATGNHTWVETGYYNYFENKRAAGSHYVCKKCGFATTDGDEIGKHCAKEKCAYSVETIWETYTDSVWVSTGYKCSVCGATK